MQLRFWLLLGLGLSRRPREVNLDSNNAQYGEMVPGSDLEYERMGNSYDLDDLDYDLHNEDLSESYQRIPAISYAKTPVAPASKNTTTSDQKVNNKKSDPKAAKLAPSKDSKKPADKKGSGKIDCIAKSL
jgi:hypothetical protein